VQLGSLRTIRLKCLDCSCQQQGQVDNCEFDTCPLWVFRYGKRPSSVAKRGKVVAEQTVTPAKALRLYCLECQKNNSAEIRDCPSTDCPSYSWRFGKSQKPPSAARIAAGKRLAEQTRHLPSKSAFLPTVGRGLVSNPTIEASGKIGAQKTLVLVGG